MLTKEQIHAAEAGGAVDVRIDDMDFVLIRRDVFERAKQLPYDDSELTDGEMRAMAAYAAQSADDAEPIE